MRSARRRSPFVDLRSAEILTPEMPRLFLGRFDESALRQELDQAGVLDGLRERGYPELSLHTEYLAGEHRLRIELPQPETQVNQVRHPSIIGPGREEYNRFSGRAISEGTSWE